MIEKGLTWPASQVEEAVTALLEKARLSEQRRSAPERHSSRTASTAERIEQQAREVGCEVVALQTVASKLPNELAAACPVIVQLASLDVLAVWKVQGSAFRVLSPDGGVHTVGVEALCAAVRSPAERAKREDYQRLFGAAGLNSNSSLRAADALAEEQFGRTPFQSAWALRRPVGQASVPQFLRQCGVFRNSFWLVLAHLAEYLLWLAAWAVMGQVAFSGQADRGWLTGWGLLLLTTVPFRVATIWLQGALAIRVGSNLKKRLLEGALKLDRDAVRSQGTGSFLSQALESEAVESLTLSGGVLGMLALVEIVVSGFILGSYGLLLAVWCCITAFVTIRFYRQYSEWTGSRMFLTGDLIENMVGHRTRSAQMPAEQLHDAEDGFLSDYFVRSKEVDRAGMWLVTGVPRGWLIAGLLWLVPSAMSGANAGTALAIKLGGVLLAFTAFQKLTSSAVEIVAAAVAARRVIPLFQAAAGQEAHSRLVTLNDQKAAGEKILEADRLSFRYRTTGPAVLHPGSLSVKRGEKILLEGSSGGGKTTLASLLSGMRHPTSGLVLLHGLDMHTIGPQRWRQRIAAAPQFHENYILTDTLAFNLLLGRPGPHGAQDQQDAEEVCRELGLGDLLDRMPGGIEQLVGEGGWQLSHGERSRIYVARALLQKADVVILDESFGALDPENLQRSLTSSLGLAETLMVIAHP